jgi:hypothetical protein
MRLSFIQGLMSAYAPDTSDRQAALERARGYPYAIPDRSYHWHGGKIDAFDPAKTEGRTAVLAVGSNQSPEQLTRKFGHIADWEIPVQRCTLDGFDVVYSAHIARYGSVPAMLQLVAMHETELSHGNYHYGRLDGVSIDLEDGATLSSVHGYFSRRGHVTHEGDGVALATVPANNRKRPAHDCAQMLAHVHERIDPAHSLDGFILRMIEDDGFRQEVIAELMVDAEAFSAPYAIVE